MRRPHDRLFESLAERPATERPAGAEPASASRVIILARDAVIMLATFLPIVGRADIAALSIAVVVRPVATENAVVAVVPRMGGRGDGGIYQRDRQQGKCD